MTTNKLKNNENFNISEGNIEENNIFYKECCDKFIDYVKKSHNVANNVAQRNSQDLTELWKNVKDFEDWYEISSTGKVRRKENAYVLKPSKTYKGYLMVVLCVNAKTTGKLVHRLVAQAFIPNPENKPQVNHINGIKTDNRVENLEWSTGSENIIHSYKKGMQKKAKKVKCMETDECFLSQAQASRKYGINENEISKCTTGKQETGGGYHWEALK